jgi:CRISPR system Cascade subunit CasE
MSLHLIELPISMRALNLWAGGRGWGSPFDEGLALHHLLGETFGPGLLQPFRLMVAQGAKFGTIYACSASDAEALRQEARHVITPALAGVIALEQLRSLPRPAPCWAPGQRLGFDIRLRPVVRLASAISGKNENGAEVAFRKGAEVDAFLAAALRDQQTSREETYRGWLGERLGAAATLDLNATRLASFQRTRVQRNCKRLEGPDAVIHGTLTISDPASFASLLARGLGRHRSYGYGMLLLRPAQRGS